MNSWTHRITQHESEARETWKPMDEAGQEAERKGIYSKLPYGAGECVRTCKDITKVCNTTHYLVGVAR